MSNKPECPICFGEDWITRTKCNHVICISCLIKLTKDECPYCEDGHKYYKEFKYI